MIKDYLGRLVQRTWLGKHTQTSDEAKYGHLHRHIGDNPTRGLDPAKLARILLEAEQGNMLAQCELAEDIEEKDPHIFAELQKRRQALLGVDWRIVPPPDATQAEKDDARMIEQILCDHLDLDDVIFDASDAILKGFSNQEITWGRVGGFHVPDLIEWRDPAWFQVHPLQRNELRLRDNSYEGAELRPFNWISHLHKSKSGYLSRRGLVRVLAWPFLFKNLSLRDLAEFLEVYGHPILIGRYESGTGDKEKATLMKAILNIGHRARGIISKSMEIEMKEAAKGGSDPFESMMNWCERAQSKAILGGTLTSQADGKSSTNALGNVHNEVRKELRNSDLKQIANTLSIDLIYPIYALNGKSFKERHRLPRLEFDLNETESLASAIDSLVTLAEGGSKKIPINWIHEKYGIPIAGKDEEVLQPRNTMPGSAMLRLSKPATGWAVLRNKLAAPDQQQLDEALQQIEDGDLNEQTLQLLEPVLALAEQGTEALQAGLMNLWPEMQDDKLQERLAQILFVSELWGQINGGDRA